MTTDDLRQKLAVEKLVETGTGMVSYRTFDEIAALCTPAQVEEDKVHCGEIHLSGIRLIRNCFIPDGEIWPFEPWGLRPVKKSFPFKVEPL